METDVLSSSLRSAEHELKYIAPNSCAPALIPWLRSRCRPHPQFPEAQISSIYYDFPDWRLLGEKLDSTFLKTKVRLRWYATGEGSSEAGQSFIEAKFKVGAQRKKVRIATSSSAAEARALPLHSPVFERMPQLLHAHGFLDTRRLTPALQITYTRLRFVHPLSRHTFCLDHKIHVARVNTLRLGRADRGFLPSAVFEQKGPSSELSSFLEWLPHFGLKRGSFSKYSTCFLHLTGTAR